MVNFLSHPVVNGFTNAAAIIIASSQFSKFFGVYVDKAPHHYETMLRVAQAAMDFTHLPTLMYGGSAVIIMVVLRKINPRIPNVLIAVAITTIISYFTGFNDDVSVDTSAFQSSDIAEKVSAFNESVQQINALGTERASTGETLDTELKKQKKGHGKSIEVINLESQVAILTSKIDEAHSFAFNRIKKNSERPSCAQ